MPAVISLGQLATQLNAQLRGGDPQTLIDGVASLAHATAHHVSFLTQPRYRRFLATTAAGAVVLAARDASDCPVPCLIVANPHHAYAHIAALFAPPMPSLQGVHPTAVIHETASVAPTAWIGPYSVIAAETVIAAHVWIGSHCVIGEHVRIGAHSRLLAQVTVERAVRIGQRAIIQPGVVIGADGFGFVSHSGQWQAVAHLGTVHIGDDVTIGANTTIARGTVDDTVIEDGVKIDNQVQIAHNVVIGAHTVIAGCVGIAGSVRIGQHCQIGGGVGIAGHLDIADHVQITGMTLISQSVTQPGRYSSGLAAQPNRLWNKIQARLHRLDEFTRRLFALERRLPPDAHNNDKNRPGA